MTTQYTDYELNAMCNQALRDEIVQRCLVAYWDNDRFRNSLIDAPERLQAVFDVVLGYTYQMDPQEVLERLRDPSQEAFATVDG